MRAVLVDVDALGLLGVDVAGDVIASVDDKAALADTVRLVGEHGAGDTSTDDEIVILCHFISLRLLRPVDSS